MCGASAQNLSHLYPRAWSFPRDTDPWGPCTCSHPLQSIHLTSAKGKFLETLLCFQSLIGILWPQGYNPNSGQQLLRPARLAHWLSARPLCAPVASFCLDLTCVIPSSWFTFRFLCLVSFCSPSGSPVPHEVLGKAFLDAAWVLRQLPCCSRGDRLPV